MTKKILIDEAVVKQALEALDEFVSEELLVGQRYTNEGQKLLDSHIALREALEVNNKGVNALTEQPDYSICPACGGMSADPIVPVEARQQAAEPVAWANPNDLQNFDMKVRTNGGPLHTVPLYTHPAPAQQDGTNGVVALQERLRQKQVALQPLTDEQIDRIADQHPAYLGSVYPHAFARAIEAALGITGSKT